MDRVAKLLDGCPLESASGLEFGPLANPLVRKDQARIFYVDYADTDTLRQKSKNDPHVDATAIVDVDFTLTDGSLEELCGPHAPFGYALASHVFEHLPNPLGWLREVSGLLAPGGRVSLAVPDRRYTFDHFRAETTPAQLVAYDLEGLTRPCLVQLTDHFYNVRQIASAAAWEATPRLENSPRYHEDEQVEWILRHAADGRYVDCHCSVWTSETFPKTMEEAFRLRRLPLRIARIHSPEPGSNEFIVQLERLADLSHAALEIA